MNLDFKISIMSVFIFFGLFSCKTTKHSVKEEIKVISKARYSEFSISENKVIRSKEEFEIILKSVHALEDIPSINWENEQVALLSLGTKRSGGYDIEVEEIIETKKEIKILYKVQSPKKGDRVSMALTSPYTIITYKNKLKKPIEFIKTEN